ncbi:unnamed protein product [Closterium sp. Yama58-4]|nr:unnamed protein product [Closterium sp. Yama58-4]
MLPRRTGRIGRFGSKASRRSPEELQAARPAAFSSAGSVSCSAVLRVAAASLLFLSANCAAVGAAASGSTSVERSRGSAESLWTAQSRHEYLTPHFPNLDIKWRDSLSPLVTRVGAALRGKSVAQIRSASKAALYSFGSGSSGRMDAHAAWKASSSSSGSGKRDGSNGSSGTTRKTAGIIGNRTIRKRRALAEIVSLSKPSGPNNGARRIPVVEILGTKDSATSNSADKPKQTTINSPYANLIGSSQGKIESWSPPENRYLVALCVYGRLSNQEQCLRNYLIAAALLQRTLVIPTKGCGVAYRTFCWRWDNIVDVPRMRACLAPAYGTNETVITVDEYLVREGRDVAIDHIACLANHSCLDNWPVMKSHFQHITLPDKLEYPVIPSKDVNDFLHAYAPYNDAPVISLGDAFGLSLVHVPFFLKSAIPPFKSTCADIWQPPPVIVNFVNGFIDTFLGSDYAAVHLRRSDFALHYLKESSEEKSQAAYLPIVTVAQFIVGRLKDRGASVVYLATDASPSEIELLERMLLGPGSTTPLVVVRLLDFAKGTQEYSHFPWVKRFQDLDSEDDGTLRATAEKHICANARFFIGTPKSTFTMDILRLRVLHGRMNEVDAFLDDQV